MKKKAFRDGWYVIYTKSNYEKRIYETLKNNFDVFLPLKKVVRQWCDRKKTLELPLFKSYVFIHLKNKKEQLQASFTEGFYCYVNIAGLPAIVTDNEIKLIKIFMDDCSNIELAASDLYIGQKRKINFGPFSGYDCYISENKGSDKVIVRIDSLRSCISAEINKVDLGELA